MLAAFGLAIAERDAGLEAALRYLDDPRTRTALLELSTAAPRIAQGSLDGLHAGSFRLLSRAGLGVVIGQGGDQDSGLRSFDSYVRDVLADPVHVRDLAVWALFFAVREASDRLQTGSCRSPTSESHLSGQLLNAIAEACDRWRKIVDAPLDRYGSTLFLHQIDLSILGGEQQTGGDFGLVLDLDGASIQPSDPDDICARGRHITPFILQAKRYVRPTADVSQHHWARGFQRHLLARNDCASAFVLYENGAAPLKRTLPPIVKPVGSVADASRTDALTGGMDLASYLVTRLVDNALAPQAQSPGDALRMIYAQGHPSLLAIVASDRRVVAHYDAEFAQLARELSDDRGEEQITVTT